MSRPCGEASPSDRGSAPGVARDLHLPSPGRGVPAPTAATKFVPVSAAQAVLPAQYNTVPSGLLLGASMLMTWVARRRPGIGA